MSITVNVSRTSCLQCFPHIEYVLENYFNVRNPVNVRQLQHLQVASRKKQYNLEMERELSDRILHFCLVHRYLPKSPARPSCVQANQRFMCLDRVWGDFRRISVKKEK
jgi:hypothetical protein